LFRSIGTYRTESNGARACLRVAAGSNGIERASARSDAHHIGI